WVLGDAMRLEQVVGNLLTNASKYSPTGSSVAVTLSREEDEVYIAVKDAGVGISSSELETIFVPFQQSAAGGKKGLGIGLALVKSFVEMHDGSIAVTSQGRGTGSTFTVRLPYYAAGESSKPEKRSPITRKSKKLATLSVLVVDDNDAAAAGI